MKNTQKIFTLCALAIFLPAQLYASMDRLLKQGTTMPNLIAACNMIKGDTSGNIPPLLQTTFQTKYGIIYDSCKKATYSSELQDFINQLSRPAYYNPANAANARFADAQTALDTMRKLGLTIDSATLFNQYRNDATAQIAAAAAGGGRAMPLVGAVVDEAVLGQWWGYLQPSFNMFGIPQAGKDAMTINLRGADPRNPHPTIAQLAGDLDQVINRTGIEYQDLEAENLQLQAQLLAAQNAGGGAPGAGVNEAALRAFAAPLLRLEATFNRPHVVAGSTNLLHAAGPAGTLINAVQNQLQALINCAANNYETLSNEFTTLHAVNANGIAIYDALNADYANLYGRNYVMAHDIIQTKLGSPVQGKQFLLASCQNLAQPNPNTMNMNNLLVAVTDITNITEAYLTTIAAHLPATAQEIIDGMQGNGRLAVIGGASVTSHAIFSTLQRILDGSNALVGGIHFPYNQNTADQLTAAQNSLKNDLVLVANQQNPSTVIDPMVQFVRECILITDRVKTTLGVPAATPFAALSDTIIAAINARPAGGGGAPVVPVNPDIATAKGLLITITGKVAGDIDQTDYNALRLMNLTGNLQLQLNAAKQAALKNNAQNALNIMNYLRL